MHVLVTGACGFIGHHVVQAMVDAGHDVIALDRLDETSTQVRLASVWTRIQFVWHDLRAPINDLVASLIGPVDAIFHLAASTHVDRSIQNSMPFVMDNVVGTANLLEYARGLDLRLFNYFGTDEQFGPAPQDVVYKDDDRYDPRNPYSATKTSAAELASAYANTYKIPVLTTHCMNVFGERQHPEKFVPLVIRAVRNGDTVPIHVDQHGIPGARFYIDAKNVAGLLVQLLDCDVPTKLNIPGTIELDNLEMAKLIAFQVGEQLRYEKVDFHSSRPGHDLRYALDGSRLGELGLELPDNFPEALGRTVKWYLANPDWLL